MQPQYGRWLLVQRRYAGLESEVSEANLIAFVTSICSAHGKGSELDF